MCAQLPVNRCDTWMMHDTSSHLACHTIYVVYRYSRYIQPVATDHEMHWFGSWATFNSILPLMKYMGMSLSINVWKHTYKVQTRIKWNSYMATYSLNHITYCVCWTVVEVDLKQKHYMLMSITWKACVKAVVLPNMSLCCKIEYGMAQTIYNFKK